MDVLCATVSAGMVESHTTVRGLSFLATTFAAVKAPASRDAPFGEGIATVAALQKSPRLTAIYMADSGF